jgi:hypothetical protein
MHVFERMAETRIAEAIERGEFDDLVGAGRPLELEDLSRVPADMRMAYKLLRDANVLPPEVELRRQIYSLGAAIEATADEGERVDLRRRRRRHQLSYSILVERRGRSR